MSIDKTSELFLSARAESDSEDLIKEFDIQFGALDRACDLLDQTLVKLAESPSPLVH